MTVKNEKQIQEDFAQKIYPFLERVKDPEKRQLIENVWLEDITPYFVAIQHIKDGLDESTLSLEKATEESLKYTTQVLEKAGELENKLDDDELVRELKGLFRITGAPFGLASKAVRHALEKPGGYPGDYELLEFIYNNRCVSEKIGYCADMVFLQDDYARAVRSRKDWMKVSLKKFFEENSDRELNILNIACGASRELREIFSEETFNFSHPVTFHMIDKSEEALNFSRDQLAGSPDKVSYNFINHSVYDFLKDPETHSKKMSGQDLIYSIGLADYIPADSLKEQIKFFFDLLKPGGEMLIAHKDSKNYIPLTPDWWADWTFYLRDEAEVVELVKTSGIENYTLTVEREDTTNIIFFLNIKKG